MSTRKEFCYIFQKTTPFSKFLTNRHEWNMKNGRSISDEDEIYDINCMKRNYINAVRTCHYPDRMSWYYRCDEAGNSVGGMKSYIDLLERL